MLALQRQAQAASTAAPAESGLSLEKIRFRHAVIDSNQLPSARNGLSFPLVNSHPLCRNPGPPVAWQFHFPTPLPDIAYPFAGMQLRQGVGSEHCE